MAVVDVNTDAKQKDLDDLIADIGGCSVYQWVTCAALHLVKLCVVWSVVTMMYAGQNPGFTCRTFKVNNVSSLTFNISEIGLENTCFIGEDVLNICTEFIFDVSMRTIVSEWNLVCNRSWIVSLIISLQMVGQTAACLVVGYVSDVYGRKPVFVVSLFALIVFNIVGAWSGSWQMYLIVRTLIGFATGSLAIVHYNLMIEVVPPTWRSITVTMPSASISLCLFALLSWGLQDWKKIHVAIAISGVPLLCASCFLSESIRWLVSMKKITEVEKTVERIAKINQLPPYNVDVCEYFAAPHKEGDGMTKNGPILEIMKSKRMFVKSAGLCIVWFACGLCSIGYIFGVGVLAGNLYTNMLALTLQEVVCDLAFGALSDRLGRNRVILSLLIISGICGISVGITQTKGLVEHGDVINAIACVAKVSSGAAHAVFTVYVLELYPTNLRSTGYGLTSTAKRLAEVLAPYIILCNNSIPGFLYNFTGSFTLLAALVICFFPETKDSRLEQSNEDEILVATRK